MIITLKGADFSSNNIGTLTSWLVTYNLKGVTGSSTNMNTVERGSAFQASFNLEESVIGEYNENNEITITMGGVALNVEDIVTYYPSVGTYEAITVNIPEVTGNIVITVKFYASDEPVSTGEVLINEFEGKTMKGGSYGSGGIMYGVQTNIPAGTYISHIDIPACSGASYSNPTSSITLDEIKIYRIDTSGLIAEELANETNITSFASDTTETAGTQIYRVDIQKTVSSTSHIGIMVNPSDTYTAPTIPYVSGTSSLGKCYMGSVKSVGNTITFNNSSYYPAFVIYK